MKLSNVKYYFLILFVVIFYRCTGQKQFLVFKVKYSNSKHVEYPSTTSYSLLSLDSLSEFELYSDSINHSPNILFNITANGGLYISESFVDIYTLGCCEYADVEKGVTKYFKGEIPKDSLTQYSRVNELSLNAFKENKGLIFSIRKGIANYDVTIWLADINYCECSLYMECPKQGIYGYKAAYIREIGAITKPNDKTQMKIKELLDKMIALDVNYQ